MTIATRTRTSRGRLAPAAGRRRAERGSRRLRICHVMSADLWAGAEVQLATTASCLVRRPDLSVAAVLLNEGRLAAELRRLGVDVTIVDEGRYGPLGIVMRLARLFAERPPDLVHTHRCKDSVLGTLAAKLAGVPHVVRTVHGQDEALRGWDALKFRAYEGLDRAVLFGFADRVVAVSNGLAAGLRESGCARVTAIRNGIDLDTVVAARPPETVRRDLGLDPSTRLIGTVGRLAPVKGHLGLLRAARLMRDVRPDVRILIVGGGPLEGRLRAAAAELGLDGAVLLPGARDDVYDLMAAMDVFVLPSLNEGTPMAVLEAMALERPVVATAVGGLPEIVQDRVTGLLVAPGDARALADACLALVGHPEWARRLGASARRAVEASFSHERSGALLADTYRSVVRGEEPGAPLGHRGIARAFRNRVAGAVRRAIERRRMARVRRRPGALRTALARAQTVLMVCHGNIIRSPFAAALIRQGGTAPVCIVSAGVEATPGRPAHPAAVAAAAARGVDLASHTALPVDAALVAASDVILAADIAVLAAMGERHPEARPKTFLLACLAPDTPLEIRDPFGGDEAAFARCFDHVSRAVGPVARALAGPARNP